MTILEKAVALSQRQGFNRELADAQSQLSEIFRESGDLEKAEEFAVLAADSTQAERGYVVCPPAPQDPRGG